jgi:3-deoxy-D-manno-octulosonic-acid transferase
MANVLDAAYLLAAAASSPAWLSRMARTGKLRTDWSGRFGKGEGIPRTHRQRILLHAVSVGEVNATRLLVEELSKADGGPEVVVATTTDTGYARACAIFEPTHNVVRYPFDATWAVRRMLDRVQPDVVGLVELEVWPNFLSACEARGIPVAVVNGRLSDRSYRRYKRLGALARNLFRRLNIVAVQDETYAARFGDLGVDPNRIEVSGNMKWDTAEITDEVSGAQELAQSMGIDPDRALVVAGSTCPPEHLMLEKAVGEGAQLLCAPRKPEWFEQAASVFPGCARRSHGDTGSESGRFLLDTIGELREAYALADVVVIGRTFSDLGGSDMIEPIALGKATIVGPDCRNFLDARDRLLKGGGLVSCAHDDLASTIAELLRLPEERRKLSECGRRVIREAQGATKRNAALLSSLLPRTAVAAEPVA